MQTAQPTGTQLERGLSLSQATAINMIDMVGIGPFIAIPLIVTQLNGVLCLFAWLLGALLAYMDSMVWAELGAKWPEAGGSYVFLQKLFGKWGKLMAFLFIWQTTIQAPLVIASGAIGFSKYLTYLVPLSTIGEKAVSGGMVILVVFLLYRNIKSIGKISIILSVITGATILWLIGSGIGHFDVKQAFAMPAQKFDFKLIFFVALGQGSIKAVYSYLGYYNACHLGAEVINPQKNIPRSMFISITIIALLYLGMQTVILGVMPWPEIAAADKHLISTYFEHIYNHTVGQVATILILCIALSSLFSVVLGYSRIPYAAAVNGDFFPIFARLHPKHKFPHISLLALGGLAFIFSLLFKMGEIITAIVTVRILIQFVSQAIGVMLWHYQKPLDERPYKMPLFPLPAIISIFIWLFILCCSQAVYILGALGIIVSGIGLYYLKNKYNPTNTSIK